SCSFENRTTNLNSIPSLIRYVTLKTSGCGRKDMNKAVIEFTRSRVFRKALRGLRLHRVSNWWLEHFPRKRVLPGSGVVYRARRTEGVSLAFEILEGGNDYDPSVLPAGYTTFADLGCNVGFFSC